MQFVRDHVLTHVCVVHAPLMYRLKIVPISFVVQVARLYQGGGTLYKTAVVL